MQPLHKGVPKTLANKVFISLNNRASNFQIFLSAGPSELSLPVLVTSRGHPHSGRVGGIGSP